MTQPKRSTPSNNRWPSRLAWALAAAALAQVVLGAMTTTYRAGMTVPDWPTTFGHNLFLYPPSQWWPPWNVRLEHGHRLFGTLLGLLALATAGVSWRCDGRRATRTLALAIVAGVCLQGGLGGLRVLGSEMNSATICGLGAPAVLAGAAASLAVAIQLAMARVSVWANPALWARIALPAAICAVATLVCVRLDIDQLLMARIHAAVASVVLAAAGALVLLASPAWRKAERSADDRGQVRLAAIIAWSLTATVFLQVSLAAPIRHVDWAADPIWFWYWTCLHLLTAAAVVGLALWLLRLAWKSRWVRLLCVVLGLQLVLGAFTWLVNYGCPPWFAQYVWEPDYTIQSAGWIESLAPTTHAVTGLGTLTLAACLAVWLGRLLDGDDGR